MNENLPFHIFSVDKKDAKKATRFIKTITADQRWPQARHKETDPYFYMLEYRGNCVLNLTKCRAGGSTWYENDHWSTTHEKLIQAKRMVVDKILDGEYGEVMQTWLRKDMGLPV